MRGFLRRKFQEVRDSWSNSLPRSLSIALDLLPADPEDAGAIRGAQISAIVRLTPIAMLASCLNAIILLATLASIGLARTEYWIWAFLVFAFAAYYFRNWLRTRESDVNRPASHRAIQRVVLNGAIFGALWGVVPAVAFPRSPLDVQLLIGVLAAGMMCAGGFVLAPVPLAGVYYVALVAAGVFYALLQQSSPVYTGLTALAVVYAAVVIVNLNWSAALFVSSRLAEARVRKEVAAREQAQTQAAHAERMTALGQLAGGIAHDFNNILQVVSGGATLIGRHPGDPDFVQAQARQIEDAVERGGAISRRLLAYGRRDVLSAELIDAAELLTEMGHLLSHTIDASIRIRTDVAMASFRFLADRLQLETVLLNLAANARDAMPNGGTLTISAASEVRFRRSADPPLKAGRYVRISVVDTGAGMDAKTLAQAGQPFFTTKPRGKGTGLGLSMAKGFAEQSGGGFAIASEPRRGTTVTLWLPEGEIGETRAGGPEAGFAQAQRENVPVLVVDDDDVVREMLMASLTDAGFLPMGAENAECALAQLDEGAKVDALVTDLSMPGMSGWDLIRELRSRAPDLPTILLTGHVGDAATEGITRPQGKRFLLMQKPVPPAQLAKRLAALVAEDGAAITDRLGAQTLPNARP